MRRIGLKSILVVFFILGGIASIAQDIDFLPKTLQKDFRKIWKVEEVQLNEIQVPDSLYDEMLLDKGKIYCSTNQNQLLGYAYIGRIYSCRSGGCGIDQTESLASADGDYEYFDYFIIYDADLAVKSIRVYNYQATHGHEVGGKGWLKQFVGYHGEEKLEYGKNIDSISGATISANAITYNVQESCRYLDLLKPILKEQKQHYKAYAK